MDFGALAGGLLQGAGQGMQLGMMYNQQQQFMELEKRRAALSEIEALGKIMNLPDNLQAPMFSKYLEGVGVDMKDPNGSGVMLKTAFDKATTEQRQALINYAQNIGIKDPEFTISSLSGMDRKSVLNHLVEVGKYQQQKDFNSKLGDIMSGGGGTQSAPSASPASDGGETQSAPGSPTMGGTSGGGIVPTPTPMPQTDETRAAVGAIGDMPIPQNVQNAMARYQRAQQVISSMAGHPLMTPEKMKLFEGIADQASKSAWMTIPGQRLSSDMKPGSVIKFNPITGEAATLQAGEDRWSVLTPAQKNALGLPADIFGQRSTSGKVETNQFRETYTPVDTSNNPQLAEVERQYGPLYQGSSGLPRPMINTPQVVMTSEKAEAAKLGEQNAAYVGQIRENRATGERVIAPAATQIREGVKGFETGAFGNQREFILNIIDLLPDIAPKMKEEVKQLIGGDKVSAEAIDAASARLAPYLGNMFDRGSNSVEFKSVRGQLPGLTKSVPGNILLADMLDRRKQLDDAISDITENHLAKGLNVDAKDKEEGNLNLRQKIVRFERENPLLTSEMKKRMNGIGRITKRLESGDRPLPPSSESNANFVGWDKTTGNPIFRRPDGSEFDVNIGN